MDIKIVDGEGNKISDTPQKPIIQDSYAEGDVVGQIERKAIGQVLGLENDYEYSKYDSELSTLLAYAKLNAKDNTPESLKWAIRSLSSKLGSPPFGEDKVKFVRNYAYLLLQEKKLEEERKKFESL